MPMSTEMADAEDSADGGVDDLRIFHAAFVWGVFTLLLAELRRPLLGWWMMGSAGLVCGLFLSVLAYMAYVVASDQISTWRERRNEKK